MLFRCRSTAALRGRRGQRLSAPKDGLDVRLLPLLGPVILIAGLATLGLAVARGEASAYLILVIPVVVGTGPIALLGILLVFLGFFLTFFLRFADQATSSLPPIETPTARGPVTKPPHRWGGVVFLGPIPLVFGSDPQVTRVMLVLGVILFFALLALTLVFLLA